MLQELGEPLKMLNLICDETRLFVSEINIMMYFPLTLFEMCLKIM